MYASQFCRVVDQSWILIFGKIHSFSHSCVPIWALPKLISTIAHALSARRFDADFNTWFLPTYLRGSGNQNITELSLKSAEYLFDLFTEVWNTLGQTIKVPRGNCKFQVCTILVQMNFTVQYEEQEHA